MKKGLFTGWRDIFAFTFKQDTKGKFARSTIIFAAIMFVVGFATSAIMALAQKKESETVSPIQKVYVINESNLTDIPTDQFFVTNPDVYPDVTFENSKKAANEAVALISTKEYDVVLEIRDTEEGYQETLLLPKNSQVSESQGLDFLNDFRSVLEVSKMISSGIPADKLVVVMSGVNVATLDAGEQEKSLGEELVAIFAPMIVILFLYIIVLIYGLSMGNAVSVEKTSKLMEMMLTMTRPYAMILGKITALATAAVIQILASFLSLAVGFGLGNVFAKNVIYSDYSNVILEVFKVIREQGVGSAFSVGATLVFVVDIVISVLFFSLLAATFGSFATKTEEVPQCMAYYQLLVVLGFFGAYLVPMQEKPWLTGIMRLIPLCSAFMLPGDVMVGNITILQAILYTLPLFACTLALVLVAGKVYKNQLFYRGEFLLARLKNSRKKCNKV